MPLKGLVKFFTIALIVLSLFQLSFTYFVNKKDKEISKRVDKEMLQYGTAKSKYANDPTKQLLYADTLAEMRERIQGQQETKAGTENVTYDPFSGNVNYKKAKGRELQLGLDLQGGMAVTMEVALDDMLKSLANNPKDPALLAAILSANQKKTGNSNFIKLFLESYKEKNASSKVAALFINKSGKKIDFNSSESTVTTYLNEQAKVAFDNTIKVITNRIDKFGLASPGISPNFETNTISVELAGAKNPDKIRKDLQTSASLEFWECALSGEVLNNLKSADALYTSAVDSTKILEKRKSIVQLLKNFGANPGFHLLGTIKIVDTIYFNAMKDSPEFTSAMGEEYKILYGKPGNADDVENLDVYVIKRNGSDKPLIAGNKITGATENSNNIMSEPQVLISLTNEGEKEFSNATARLSANGQKVGYLGIVLDDFIYSAPSVKQKIDGGPSISGGFKDIGEAKELSDILNSGRLEVKARIVQDNIVGPTLGKKAIEGGATAFLISFLVIFALMIIYYNTAGWVANIALILNLLFTIGILSALGATLTAPGIAGLVLTIGMAVDTNVIIFERIKEELEKGKTYMAAVIEGYKKSLAPVLDAHFTTFLTAAILFYFGEGPIKGFATTQMLGIFLSLFCGILISRLITDFYTNKNRHLNYFTGLSRKIFKHANYKFIEYRKITYIISGVVLLLGVGAVINGFDSGVEYAGGRSYVVQLSKEKVTSENLRTSLAPVFGGKEPVIKTVNNSDKIYDITTSFKINDVGDETVIDSTVRYALYNGIKPYIGDNITESAFAKGENKIGIISSKKVKPSISEKLKEGAKKAAIYSILIIALYIFIRFRDWRYSLGTIIALLHDVFVTLAVFSFCKGIVPFPLELDQHFIAAILTVIGFSMNDTIIVFDRIRENAKLMKGASKTEIINKSINATLSRTVMTSLTVFLTILILLIFGGDVTRGFAFAMLIGVIVGTYSSIFVAAPILVDFAKNTPLGKADFVDHENETTSAAEKAIKNL
jgi:SecD/SecF fusion protein